MSVNLPEKILALRKARGMSQADLAEKLYVTRQTVSRWERGSAAPDAENLLRLAQVLMSAWTNCWASPQPPGSQRSAARTGPGLAMSKMRKRIKATSSSGHGKPFAS